MGYMLCSVLLCNVKPHCLCLTVSTIFAAKPDTPTPTTGQTSQSVVAIAVTVVAAFVLVLIVVTVIIRRKRVSAPTWFPEGFRSVFHPNHLHNRVARSLSFLSLCISD